MKNADMPANPVKRDNWWENFLKGISGGKSYGLTKREHFASIAPYDEITDIIGESAESAASFLDMTKEDYLKYPRTNYIKCCMLARRMWADELLKELDK